MGRNKKKDGIRQCAILKRNNLKKNKLKSLKKLKKIIMLK